MKFLIGKKREMTQIFTEEGTFVPVTKIVAGPCFVSQKKDLVNDGYRAIQLAWDETAIKRVNKPLLGFFKKAFGKEIAFKHLSEFRMTEVDPIFDQLNVGQKLDVSIFEKGDKVDVEGTSKGKGFQGVVRRHHFHGHPKTHGHKDQLRMPGSIGATGPQNVSKGMRMGGHMGDEQITIQKLEIMEIDLVNNIIYVKGSIPGAMNSVVYLTAEGNFEVKVTPIVTQAEVVLEEKEPSVDSELISENQSVDNVAVETEAK